MQSIFLVSFLAFLLSPAEVKEIKPPLIEVQEIKPTPVEAEAVPMISEEIRTHLIEYGMKYCLGTFDSPTFQKTWTKKEIEDYCGCGSTLQANRTTQAEYDLRQIKGSYSNEWYKMKEEVGRYCMKTYVKTPDVTTIKNKKW